MAELISAVAQLMWPLIALCGLLVFRRAIGRLLRTAERREMEFEIGGQRLTLHELNDQQNGMIQDLQRQLSMLSAQLEERDSRIAELAGAADPSPAVRINHEQAELTDVRTLPEPPPASSLARPGGSTEPGPPPQAPVDAEPFAVLWVDDRPENDALLIQQLRENGVRVTTASTTADALTEIQERPYRLIVSDMSRQEDGQSRPDAGLALVQELRDLGVDTPVIIFGGRQGRLQYSAQARQAGAVATTTSAYEMFKHFQNFGLL